MFTFTILHIAWGVKKIRIASCARINYSTFEIVKAKQNHFLNSLKTVNKSLMQIHSTLFDAPFRNSM